MVSISFSWLSFTMSHHYFEPTFPPLSFFLLLSRHCSRANPHLYCLHVGGCFLVQVLVPPHKLAYMHARPGICCWRQPCTGPEPWLVRGAGAVVFVRHPVGLCCQYCLGESLHLLVYVTLVQHLHVLSCRRVRVKLASRDHLNLILEKTTS